MDRPDNAFVHTGAMDFLPYSRPLVDEDDIRAVSDSLRNPMISQGETLSAFEEAFAEKTHSRFAVGYSSGTAALHGMCAAAGLNPGDDVLCPALTFAGTSNAVLYCGGRPRFVDINPNTLCIEPETIEEHLPEACRAILTVDFAGQAVDYDGVRRVAEKHGLVFLSDSAHAPGGSYKNQPVGSLADMTAFSFNPVKNMTSAEGGMVTTNDPAFAQRLRMFRVHGMTSNPSILEHPSPGGWYYEQQLLGMNYKLSELHAALGLCQLKKLDRYNARRREITDRYRQRLSNLPVRLPSVRKNTVHTWHLFVIRIEPEAPIGRDVLFSRLREDGIGVQVHYIPVPRHPFYQDLGYSIDGLEETQRYYQHAISIPVHPAMTDADVDRVIDALERYLT